MEPNQGIRTWQWVVTVIVIIILIILGYYLFRGDNDGVDVNNNNATATSTDSVDANEVNRITVADQALGNVVYVSSAQLANGGWVVIHKDNAGKPGAVVGSTYVEAGIAPVRVNLTEQMTDGGTYYAMLHADDGDKTFDAAKDLPLKNSLGSEIIRVFKASSTVTEIDKG